MHSINSTSSLEPRAAPGATMVAMARRLMGIGFHDRNEQSGSNKNV